ncbi:hypothetical protein ACF068_26455 [Streptomyces sp. NPDC016309]|uniref:hypothetical protein n=1 Tax=Streptomyces sp. NPDC016309 TaxID=3364965 RepID=UPI0036FA18D4
MKRILPLILVPVLLSGCGLWEEAPKGDKIAPPQLPTVQNEGRAVSEAESFTAWVSERGNEEQRNAVIGHVSMVWGDWNTPGELGFVVTDHTEKAPAQTVAETFAGWEDNAETTVRAAVYGKGGELLYVTGP